MLKCFYTYELVAVDDDSDLDDEDFDTTPSNDKLDSYRNIFNTFKSVEEKGLQSESPLICTCPSSDCPVEKKLDLQLVKVADPFNNEQEFLEDERNTESMCSHYSQELFTIDLSQHQWPKAKHAEGNNYILIDDARIDPFFYKPLLLTDTIKSDVYRGLSDLINPLDPRLKCNRKFSENSPSKEKMNICELSGEIKKSAENVNLITSFTFNKNLIPVGILENFNSLVKSKREKRNMNISSPTCAIKGKEHTNVVTTKKSNSSLVANCETFKSSTVTAHLNGTHVSDNSRTDIDKLACHHSAANRNSPIFNQPTNPDTIGSDKANHSLPVDNHIVQGEKIFNAISNILGQNYGTKQEVMPSSALDSKERIYNGEPVIAETSPLDNVTTLVPSVTDPKDTTFVKNDIKVSDEDKTVKTSADEEQLHVNVEQLHVNVEQLDVNGEQLDVNGEQLDVNGEQLDVYGGQLDVNGEQLDVNGEQLDVYGGQLDVNSNLNVKQLSMNIIKDVLSTVEDKAPVFINESIKSSDEDTQKLFHFQSNANGNIENEHFKTKKETLISLNTLVCSSVRDNKEDTSVTDGVSRKRPIVCDDTVVVGDDTVVVGDDTVVVGDDTVVVGDDTVVVGDDTVVVVAKKIKLVTPNSLVEDYKYNRGMCSVCFLTKLMEKKVKTEKKSNSNSCPQCQTRTRLLCPTCGKSFSNLLVLYAHLLNHNQQSEKAGELCCSLCKMQSGSELHFYKHMAFSNCSTVCIICESIFKSHKLKANHNCKKKRLKKMLKIESAILVQCQVCQKVETCAGDRRLKKKYFCEKCLKISEKNKDSKSCFNSVLVNPNQDSLEKEPRDQAKVIKHFQAKETNKSLVETTQILTHSASPLLQSQIVNVPQFEDFDAGKVYKNHPDTTKSSALRTQMSLIQQNNTESGKSKVYTPNSPSLLTLSVPPLNEPNLAVTSVTPHKRNLSSLSNITGKSKSPPTKVTTPNESKSPPTKVTTPNERSPPTKVTTPNESKSPPTKVTTPNERSPPTKVTTPNERSPPTKVTTPNESKSPPTKVTTPNESKSPPTKVTTPNESKSPPTKVTTPNESKSPPTKVTTPNESKSPPTKVTTPNESKSPPTKVTTPNESKSPPTKVTTPNVSKSSIQLTYTTPIYKTQSPDILDENTCKSSVSKCMPSDKSKNKSSLSDQRESNLTKVTHSDQSKNKSSLSDQRESNLTKVTHSDQRKNKSSLSDQRESNLTKVTHSDQSKNKSSLSDQRDSNLTKVTHSDQSKSCLGEIMQHKSSLTKMTTPLESKPPPIPVTLPDDKTTCVTFFKNLMASDKDKLQSLTLTKVTSLDESKSISSVDQPEKRNLTKVPTTDTSKVFLLNVISDEIKSSFTTLTPPEDTKEIKVISPTKVALIHTSKPSLANFTPADKRKLFKKCTSLDDSKLSTLCHTSLTNKRRASLMIVTQSGESPSLTKVTATGGNKSSVAYELATDKSKSHVTKVYATGESKSCVTKVSAAHESKSSFIKVNAYNESKSPLTKLNADNKSKSSVTNVMAADESKSSVTKVMAADESKSSVTNVMAADESKSSVTNVMAADEIKSSVTKVKPTDETRSFVSKIIPSDAIKSSAKKVTATVESKSSVAKVTAMDVNKSSVTKVTGTDATKSSATNVSATDASKSDHIKVTTTDAKKSYVTKVKPTDEMKSATRVSLVNAGKASASPKMSAIDANTSFATQITATDARKSPVTVTKLSAIDESKLSTTMVTATDTSKLSATEVVAIDAITSFVNKLPAFEESKLSTTKVSATDASKSSITKVNATDSSKPSVTKATATDSSKSCVTKVASNDSSKSTVTKLTTTDSSKPSVTKVNATDSSKPSVAKVNSTNSSKPSVTNVSKPNQSYSPSLTKVIPLAVSKSLLTKTATLNTRQSKLSTDLVDYLSRSLQDGKESPTSIPFVKCVKAEAKTNDRKTNHSQGQIKSKFETVYSNDTHLSLAGLSPLNNLKKDTSSITKSSDVLDTSVFGNENLKSAIKERDPRSVKPPNIPSAPLHSPNNRHLIMCRNCAFSTDTHYKLDTHLHKVHCMKKKYYCRNNPCNRRFVLEKCLDMHHAADHKSNRKLFKSDTSTHKTTSDGKDCTLVRSKTYSGTHRQTSSSSSLRPCFPKERKRPIDVEDEDKPECMTPCKNSKLSCTRPTFVNKNMYPLLPSSNLTVSNLLAQSQRKNTLLQNNW